MDLGSLFDFSKIDFDLSKISIGAVMNAFSTALGGIMSVFGVSQETGRGLLSFLDFFTWIGETFVSLITKLGGLF